ncbi:COG1361 S-layer family protein [Methanoregula sp.]|uniref:COG1361 S-layer family protein n=1 Tax=Methanoregula sp. TaxID=2052170 RepID=UPI003567B23B
MNLKTLIIVIILSALFVATIPPVSGESAPTVTITDYKVNPSVLMPDSPGTITITVKNTASSAQVSEKSGFIGTDSYATVKTTDINVNLDNVRLEGNGLMVVSGNFDRVGALGPGQSMQFTFSIQAPSKNGLYYPEVWIDTAGGKSVKYPIPVNVNTALGIQKKAIIILDSTLTGSQNPGDEIPVQVTVLNSGDMLSEDVVLKIENISTTMVAPKNTDIYHLGTLSAGKNKTIDMILLSDKKMTAGLVKVPVTISYNAIDGTQKTQTSSIDILFKGKAEIGFVSVDTSPPRLTENTPFDLTIRIENTGTGEAKQVSAKVDLPAEGKKESFIGKIKPGNDAPAIFLLEGAPAGTHPYNLTVTYTDDMGVHVLNQQMTLRVPPTDTSGSLIFGLIVLVILGFLAYRYWYLPKYKGDGKFPWERKS